MIENLSQSIQRQEEKASKPPGFYALKSITGKYWDIYFKLSIDSHSQIIQLNLTEKKAKTGAILLNSILNAK